MRFSCFAPLGLYSLSSKEPRAKRIYRAMVSCLGDQLDLTPGESPMEAKVFATALAEARAAKTQERAAAQALMSKVGELMPVREQEYRITPTYGATTAERRALLVRRRKRPGTWTLASMRALLQEVIGSDFLALRPTPLAEVVRWPEEIGDSPMNLVSSFVTRKIIRTTNVISLGLPGTQTVGYELVYSPQSPDVATSVDLLVGDRLVIDPHLRGVTDCVTVTAVSVSPKTFTATGFVMPHDTGALGFTHPWPRWSSSKRNYLVILTPAAARNPDVRRVVHTEMARMARACSTWDICESADSLTSGAFELDGSFLDSQTIESVTF